MFTLQTNTLRQFPVWEARLWDFTAKKKKKKKKYFQIKLSCVVGDDEKLTHIIEGEQFSFKSRASFCQSTATIIKLIRKPDKIAGSLLALFPWHRAGNWLEWTTGSVVSYAKWCHIINYLLTSLARDRTGEYWPSVVFGRTSLRSQSVVPRPRANIPQYGPHVHMVRG